MKLGNRFKVLLTYLCILETTINQSNEKSKLEEVLRKRFWKLRSSQGYIFFSETLTSLSSLKTKNKKTQKPKNLKIAELPSAIVGLFCSSCRLASCIEMNIPKLGKY